MQVVLKKLLIDLKYFRKKRFKLKNRKSKAITMKSGAASVVARSNSDIGDAKDLNEEEVRFLDFTTNHFCLMSKALKFTPQMITFLKFTFAKIAVTK